MTKIVLEKLNDVIVGKIRTEPYEYTAIGDENIDGVLPACIPDGLHVELENNVRVSVKVSDIEVLISELVMKRDNVQAKLTECLAFIDKGLIGEGDNLNRSVHDFHTCLRFIQSDITKLEELKKPGAVGKWVKVFKNDSTV